MNLSIAQPIQTRSVPAVVLNTFQQQFPKAGRVEWERHGDGNYEVEFTVGLTGRHHKVAINHEGKMLIHEEEIAYYSLPDAIKQHIMAAFGGYRIGGAKKIEQGGNRLYEVELDSRHGDLEIYFNAAGQVLKKQVE
ncbi:PepSY-like domain-containing protein [Parapedobacter deserti]|uniref:PepSY-like domain-containing protein n=1 Tax=Parapedobacter deserti TaxID=1912957 RepID=A0ABV7JI51_9SPHI